MFRALRFASARAAPAMAPPAPLAPLARQSSTTVPAVRRKSANSSRMKSYKPRTPGLRWVRRPLNPHLHKGKPMKALTIPRRRNGGRNNTGRITVRHRGGGHKQRIRRVDFARYEPGVQTIQRIEYDPGRSAHIALLKHDVTGVYSYIVACTGQRAGDTVESFRRGVTPEVIASVGGSTDPGMIAARVIKVGNCLPMHMIPQGTRVCCIGLHNYGPAQMCRSAGTSGVVLNNDADGYAIIRLASGELRKVQREACATIGTVSNPNWKHRSLGKAGRARWLGRRPSVRGVAMSPHDHPHGGGRGKSKGNKHPQSPWGTLKFARTRKSKHNQNKLLVKGRPRGKEKNRAKA